MYSSKVSQYERLHNEWNVEYDRYIPYEDGANEKGRLLGHNEWLEEHSKEDIYIFELDFDEYE